mgnify:CR=1 FL=1
MEINFENARCTSKNYLIEGKMDDGRTFTLILNWNEGDDWNLTSDEIMFDDGVEYTEEECDQIIETVLNNYY